jgi:mutator protein MutT
MSPERPLIGVGAVVVKDGSLLMVQRGEDPYAGLWSVPGGMLEHGEYLTDAVRREVLEETGIEVQVGELLGVLEFWRGPHYVILDYVATTSSDEEPKPGDDAAEVRWVPLDEVPSMECTPRFVETLRGWGVLSTDE